MGTESRHAYPSDVTDEEWEFALPYLTLMKEDAPQRDHLILPRKRGPAGVLQREHNPYGNITEQVWQEI